MVHSGFRNDQVLIKRRILRISISVAQVLRRILLLLYEIIYVSCSQFVSTLVVVVASSTTGRVILSRAM